MIDVTESGPTAGQPPGPAASVGPGSCSRLNLRPCTDRDSVRVTVPAADSTVTEPEPGSARPVLALARDS